MYEALAFLEVLFEFRNPHVQEGSKELIKLNENQIFQILQSGLRSTTVVYKERYTMMHNSLLNLMLFSYNGGLLGNYCV